jgi:hypothetical protein
MGNKGRSFCWPLFYNILLESPEKLRIEAPEALRHAALCHTPLRNFFIIRLTPHRNPVISFSLLYVTSYHAKAGF